MKKLTISWLKMNRWKIVGVGVALILGLIGAYYIFASIIPSQIQANAGGIEAGNFYVGSMPPNDSSMNLKNLAQIDPVEAKQGIYFEIAALIAQAISTFL